MIYISLLISIVYFLLIITFVIGFHNIECIQNKTITPKNTFSIVIPFRNEANNLPNLLSSLSVINYPTNLFEILLVNDYSKDNFKEIIEDFIQQNQTLNITLIHNKTSTNSPKKDAITTAIKQSKFKWITTTDADCIVPKNWLLIFNQYIEEKQPLFISASVNFNEKSSLLFHFQNLNFLSLIGSTIGGFGIKQPIMCNGANLCYHKDSFIEVSGFEGNSQIASGDDIFLLEKMSVAFPNKISYLKCKESIIHTNSENNLNSFFNQQIRWASKYTAYNSKFAKFVGATVFTMNLILIILLILTIINPNLWCFFTAIFIQKFVVDYILISKTSLFLNNSKKNKYYPLISLLYPFFIIIIGITAQFKSYKWKGRDFKK